MRGSETCPRCNACACDHCRKLEPEWLCHSCGFNLRAEIKRTEPEEGQFKNITFLNCSIHDYIPEQYDLPLNAYVIVCKNLRDIQWAEENKK